MSLLDQFDRILGRALGVKMSVRVSLSPGILLGRVSNLSVQLRELSVAGLLIESVDVRLGETRVLLRLPPTVRITDISAGVTVTQDAFDRWTRIAALPVRLRFRPDRVVARTGLAGLRLGEAAVGLTVENNLLRLAPLSVNVLGFGLGSPSEIFAVALPLPPLPHGARVIDLTSYDRRVEVTLGVPEFETSIGWEDLRQLRSQSGNLGRFSRRGQYETERVAEQQRVREERNARRRETRVARVERAARRRAARSMERREERRELPRRSSSSPSSSPSSLPPPSDRSVGRRRLSSARPEKPDPSTQSGVGEQDAPETPENGNGDIFSGKSRSRQEKPGQGKSRQRRRAPQSSEGDLEIGPENTPEDTPESETSQQQDSGSSPSSPVPSEKAFREVSDTEFLPDMAPGSFRGNGVSHPLKPRPLNTTPDETLPGETVPDETLPGETVSGDDAASDASPNAPEDPDTGGPDSPGGE